MCHSDPPLLPSAPHHVYSICTQPCPPTGSSSHSCYWLKVGFFFFTIPIMRIQGHHSFLSAVGRRRPEVVFYSWVMFMTMCTHRPAVWMKARAIHHGWERFQTLTHVLLLKHCQLPGGGTCMWKWWALLIHSHHHLQYVEMYFQLRKKKKKRLIPAKSRAVQGERWD